MVSLIVHGSEVCVCAKGKSLEVCTEHLTAIDCLRDKLAKHMEIDRHEANSIIMESLKTGLE